MFLCYLPKCDSDDTLCKSQPGSRPLNFHLYLRFCQARQATGNGYAGLLTCYLLLKSHPTCLSCYRDRSSVKCLLCVKMLNVLSQRWSSTVTTGQRNVSQHDYLACYPLFTKRITHQLGRGNTTSLCFPWKCPCSAQESKCLQSFLNTENQLTLSRELLFCITDTFSSAQWIIFLHQDILLYMTVELQRLVD